MSAEQFILKNIPKGMPVWAATGFKMDDGEIYVPAVLGCGNENVVFLAMGYDGTSMAHDKGHLYAPLSWMEREYPENEKTWNHIKDSYQKASAQ